MDSKVTWIFLFLMLYWSYCIFEGIKGARGARTADDYFLAGRQLPFAVYIFAATGTSFSGWTFLGHPGFIYTDGWQYAYGSFYAITIPFSGLLFLKRQWLLSRRFGLTTPGEMLAQYFESRLLRLLVILVTLMFSIPYVGLQLRAAGFLFNVLTNGLVDIDFGMWVLAIMVVSYVASGGLRTAAYIDRLQTLLMVAGIVIIGVIALHYVGGWARLTAGIAALGATDPVRTPEGYSHYLAIPGIIQIVRDGTAAEGGPWTGTMILTYLFALMGLQASPAFSMWAFASRSPAPFAAQQVWASALLFGFMLIVLTAIQGIGGHFLGADQAFLAAHPSLVNPVMVGDLGGRDLLDMPGRQDLLVPLLIDLMSGLAPWLVGLLVVCALSAMESTASCYMVTAGGILTRDLVRPFLLPQADDRLQKFVGRIATVLVVVLALITATLATRALVLLGGLAVSYGLQMGPALVAVCYWPFLTRQGVTLGLIVGLVAVTLTEPIGQEWLGITAWGPWPLTIHAAGWGIFVNFTVAILVSLVTRDDLARKRQFHAFLRRHTALPPAKRRLVPLAWGLTLLWFGFGIGPGAVIGNTLFGDPNHPETWWFGLPSIWTWQIGVWVTGVGLMWFLAYAMEMATPRQRRRA